MARCSKVGGRCLLRHGGRAGKRKHGRHGIAVGVIVALQAGFGQDGVELRCSGCAGPALGAFIETVEGRVGQLVYLLARVGLAHFGVRGGPEEGVERGGQAEERDPGVVFDASIHLLLGQVDDVGCAVKADACALGGWLGDLW